MVERIEVDRKVIYICEIYGLRYKDEETTKVCQNIAQPIMPVL